MQHDTPVAFNAELVEWEGPAAWHFVHVPDELAPDFAGAFGRVPVLATVDGYTWSTSIWRDKEAGWLLAVPKSMRRGKGDGDVVTAAFVVDESRL